MYLELTLDSGLLIIPLQILAPNLSTFIYSSSALNRYSIKDIYYFTLHLQVLEPDFDNPSIDTNYTLFSYNTVALGRLGALTIEDLWSCNFNSLLLARIEA